MGGISVAAAEEEEELGHLPQSHAELHLQVISRTEKVAAKAAKGDGVGLCKLSGARSAGSSREGDGREGHQLQCLLKGRALLLVFGGRAVPVVAVLKLDPQFADFGLGQDLRDPLDDERCGLLLVGGHIAWPEGNRTEEKSVALAPLPTSQRGKGRSSF